MSEPSTELVVLQTGEVVFASTGEIVDLSDVEQCVAALKELGAMSDRIKEARSVLAKALARIAADRATKTFHLPSGVSAVVNEPKETIWDVTVLEELVAAGLPADRFNDLVSYEQRVKVDAGEARRIAAAKPEYGEIIERAKTVRDKAPYVTIT